MVKMVNFICTFCHTQKKFGGYGNQTLRYPPIILASWDSFPCIISSDWVWAGLSDWLLKNSTRQKYSIWLKSPGHQTNCGITLSFGSLIWGKPSTMLWRAPWTSIQWGTDCLSIALSELGSRSNSCQALIWLQPQVTS